MVKSAKELQPVLKLGDKVYLRKNINQVEVTDEMTGENRQEWHADEYMFKLDELRNEPTIQEIENNFELYYGWAKEKREKENEIKQKKQEVEKLIDEHYDLADLKETVDMLLAQSLM